MRRILSYLPLLVILLGILPHAHAASLPLPVDSLPEASLVYIEAEDSNGRVMQRSVGIIVKDGFVALNYHVIAGADSVRAYMHGDPHRYTSDGYLSVDEGKDVIVISVPGLKGPPGRIDGLTFPADGSSVTILLSSGNRRHTAIPAKIKGRKDINSYNFPQATHGALEDCTNGPVFHNGGLVGFVTAGYNDHQGFAYIMPASELRRLLGRSFIIKAFNSLKDTRPLKNSAFQDALMSNLKDVLWVEFEDLARLKLTRPKMVIVDVRSKWAGWGQFQDRNYKSKRVIRYLNENYYTVRFDPESRDTITFNGMQYHPGTSDHALAYSLLSGKMEYPATVFMDERLTVLFAVPGSIKEERFYMLLHFFAEKAYGRKTVQEFEQEFKERQ